MHERSALPERPGEVESHISFLCEDTISELQWMSMSDSE